MGLRGKYDSRMSFIQKIKRVGQKTQERNQNRMKKNTVRKQTVIFMSALTAAAMLTGCGRPEEGGRESSSAFTAAAITTEREPEGEAGGAADSTAEGGETAVGATALEVRFGDDGEPFIMQLEDNATAAAIAGYVGTADWRLPIYHYDDYEDWEVMQYYDIPSRYEIPSNAESVTSEKAGEVYYSEPNRIILFYQDGEVAGEYTKIGTIEDSGEFREAVENNPVLEGWGNKIVLINSVE